MKVKRFALVLSLCMLAACTFQLDEPITQHKQEDSVALDTAFITPMVDPNSLVPGDPAAKVFEIQSGTITEKADIDFNNQRFENKVATIWTTLIAAKITPYEFTSIGVSPTFTVSGAIASATYVDTPITLDIPSVAVGDDVRIRAWGNWQFNSSSSPGDVVGRARIKVREDVDGTPNDVFPAGVATIYDDSGALALPHNEPYTLNATHRCTTAGKMSVTVQAKYEDLTGGAATGTIIFVFSARLDVDHYNRN